MRKWVIIAFLFLSVCLPVAMHFWTNDDKAIITPFPLYYQPIHPRAWANLWLERLRLLILLFILYRCLPTLRGIVGAYLIFEALSVADWFIRYGQDIFVTGFDANVIAIAAMIAAISCYIIYPKHETK
jgi:hypothetical protein